MTVFKSKLESLNARSTQALSLFQRTVSNLAKINEEIQDELIVNRGKIDELKAKRSQLEQTHYTNESVIDKINQFFGLEG